MLELRKYGSCSVCASENQALLQRVFSFFFLILKTSYLWFPKHRGKSPAFFKKKLNLLFKFKYHIRILVQENGDVSPRSLYQYLRLYVNHLILISRWWCKCYEFYIFLWNQFCEKYNVRADALSLNSVRNV